MVRDGVRPLRAPRRPGALPPGRRRGDTGRRARDRADRAPSDRRRGPTRRSDPRRRSTTGSPSAGFVVVEGADDGRARVARGRRVGAIASRSSAWARPASPGESWPTPAARAAAAGAPTGAGIASAARLRAPGDPTDLTVGRGRLLQHAARGRQRTLHSLHAATTSAASTTSTTRSSSSRTAPPPDAALGAEFVRELRRRVPLPRPRRRRHAVAGPRAQPRASQIARGADDRLHDRRRARAHPGRAALRRCRAASLRARPSSRPSSGTSARASRATPMAEGYDQDYEDRLFEHIDWPERRLPAVRDRPLHRRARLVRRPVGEQLPVRARASSEQVGGFDERFSMPGGGFANLDLYERLSSSPGVTLVTILGEGRSTRSTAAPRPTRPTSMRALRAPGRLSAPVHGPARQALPARRAVSLRRLAFRIQRGGPGPGGWAPRPSSTPPTRSQRMAGPTSPRRSRPSSRAEFTEAYWRSFRWQRTRWMGRIVPRCPADLLAYAELDLRLPARTGSSTSSGRSRAPRSSSRRSASSSGTATSSPWGRTAASSPRRIDCGRSTATRRRPRRSRAVREAVGESRGDARHRPGKDGRGGRRVRPLSVRSCPSGSSVIFESTVTNGHPVWPGMGQGPPRPSPRSSGATTTSPRTRGCCA